MIICSQQTFMKLINPRKNSTILQVYQLENQKTSPLFLSDKGLYLAAVIACFAPCCAATKSE